MRLPPRISPRMFIAIIMGAAVLGTATLVFAAEIPAETSAYAPGFGPHPVLPKPEHSLVPTVNTAKAVGWPEGAKPQAATGFKVDAFATGLAHPRWLYTLPNGDVLVAETDAPEKPDDGKGIKGFFMKLTMKKVGASKGSPNRITLLRDTDGDGRSDQKSTFLENLNSPFGMALVGHTFYVADTDAVMAYAYHDGDTKPMDSGRKVADLPAGTINHHWTKNIAASPDGKYLYVTVGSNSNVGENGMEVEQDRAAIHRIDLASGQMQPFASGLRNPNGMDFQPDSGVLWTVANERDELGNDLVPDYLTSVRQDAFYGWPFTYYGQNADSRIAPQTPEQKALAESAIAPDYALGAHTASLGLVFDKGSLFGADFKGGAFVGQHGSWNREPLAGYKVIFVPFKDGMPSGPPQDILRGFVSDKAEAMGRPVGVTFDKTGALLVADDVGNAVWRVTP